MNIAILITELGGGGAERVSQILGDYYIEKGHKVYYFLADTNVRQDYPVKGTIVQTKIKKCMNGNTSKVRGYIRLFCSAIEMKRLKKIYKIDVSISFMEEFNYINILSKGKERVITRICSVLSLLEQTYSGSIIYNRKNLRFFYRKADKVVVMCKWQFDDLQLHYGIPARKIKIIPNMAVHRNVLDGVTRPWKYGDKAVVCVIRLHPVKQCDRIIRAFCHVVQREDSSRLVVLGKGAQREYLQRLCEKYDIADKVFFEGFTDDVTYYLQHARVFVLASKYEGFPNCMIEAMNYGVPVVTTDSPGACGEIVGKEEKKINRNTYTLCKYGILTPYMPLEKLKVDSELSEQEKILGEAILKVLTENDTYEHYRKQSLKRADMFRIDRVMKKWDRLLKQN